MKITAVKGTLGSATLSEAVLLELKCTNTMGKGPKKSVLCLKAVFFLEDPLSELWNQNQFLNLCLFIAVAVTILMSRKISSFNHMSALGTSISELCVHIPKEL